jgi:hypothetical protein
MRVAITPQTSSLSTVGITRSDRVSVLLFREEDAGCVAMRACDQAIADLLHAFPIR